MLCHENLEMELSIVEILRSRGKEAPVARPPEHLQLPNPSGQNSAIETPPSGRKNPIISSA